MANPSECLIKQQMRFFERSEESEVSFSFKKKFVVMQI